MYTANADRGGMLDSLFASEMNDPSPYDKFGQLWFTMKETNTTLRNLAYELRLGRQLGYDSEDHLNLLIDTLKRELAYNSKKGICDPAMLSIGKNDLLPIGTELNLGIQQATFNEPYQFYFDVTFSLTGVLMKYVDSSVSMSSEDWIMSSKSGGQFDLKSQSGTIFGQCRRGDRSKFLRFNHLFMVAPLSYPPYKLLRYDDPGNMLFGMSSKIRHYKHNMSFDYKGTLASNTKGWIYETAGELVNPLTRLPQDAQITAQAYAALSSVEAAWESKDISKLGFDDPRDQAAIVWGWNNLDYFYHLE